MNADEGFGKGDGAADIDLQPVGESCEEQR